MMQKPLRLLSERFHTNNYNLCRGLLWPNSTGQVLHDVFLLRNYLYGTKVDYLLDTCNVPFMIFESTYKERKV